jgi:hypothetical protein
MERVVKTVCVEVCVDDETFVRELAQRGIMATCVEVYESGSVYELVGEEGALMAWLTAEYWDVEEDAEDAHDVDERGPVEVRVDTHTPRRLRTRACGRTRRTRGMRTLK